MLNTVIFGEHIKRPPLLIAHGLFGSARNWGVIARRLADTRQVIAVDMRNHGESPWFDSHTYSDLAADLAEVIDSHGGLADVVGHSMGGKAAMMLALCHPGLINRLVVADIAPTRYDHSQSHLIDAMRAIDLDGLSSRAAADADLAHLVQEAPVRAFLLQSLDIKEKRWRLNLDVLEAEMATIVGWPDIDTRADVPALFLAGAESTYVSAESRAAIRRLFPAARFAKIPGAGHWLHAEKPREFEAAVRVFFDAQAAAAG